MSSDSSRRSFILGTGGAALAAATPSLWVGADAAEVIKVGFVSPRTGPLAGFGECDPFVISLARKALAGGLMSGGKRYAVEILDRDSQSDPTRAGQLANELISKDGVDSLPVGSVVLRARRKAGPALTVQMDVSLQLRRQ